MEETPPAARQRRIANACDLCRRRKVKCNGGHPCGFCVEHHRSEECHYSGPKQRRTRRNTEHITSRSTESPSTQTRRGSAITSPLPPAHSGPGPADPVDQSPEDDTDVPREARLLCDAEGKLIFIGDCAPLSFFQSVRQLVTSKISHGAFAPETSRYSVLEVAPTISAFHKAPSQGTPKVVAADVARAATAYLSTTAGLVDLFDRDRLTDDLLLWANLDRKPDDLNSILNYLVLAIGRLSAGEDSSSFFDHARDAAYQSLGSNLSVGTVQAFCLITIYMLFSSQINGAFLFFGISVRAAYSIGLHRTEVNARFGAELHQQRDRLWKSLRIVDLFLSNYMGRPPATSDVDCTVPYRTVDDKGLETFDLQNSFIQILLIGESIVTEIYSRRKVSLRLTEGISLQLRDWSAKWLPQLKEIVKPGGDDAALTNGACQVLATYYYAVMLVSRPFLMFELCQRLENDPGPRMSTGKLRLADACIDAASLMVDPILRLVETGALYGPMPLLVSWMFASSLVLGLGVLGGFGRILEKYARMSIRTLDSFSSSNAHATQYSLIAQSLLNTATEHLEKRELLERQKRTEGSSRLFGLLADDGGGAGDPKSTSSATPVNMRRRDSVDRSVLSSQGFQTGSPRFEIDSSFFGLTDSVLQTPDTNYWNANFGNEGDTGSALNLFPLLEASGGIDLAHYL